MCLRYKSFENDRQFRLPKHKLSSIGAAADYLIERLLGAVVPMPCVDESLHLGLGLFTAWFVMQNVVAGLRVEGRV